MSNAMTRSTIIKRTPSPSPSPSLTGIVFLGKLLSVNRIVSLTHLGLILYRMSYLQACYQTPHRSLPLLTIVWFIVFFRRHQSDAIAQDPESESWLLIGPQAITSCSYSWLSLFWLAEEILSYGFTLTFALFQPLSYLRTAESELQLELLHHRLLICPQAPSLVAPGLAARLVGWENRLRKRTLLVTDRNQSKQGTTRE